jgi:hypothetical protein
LQLHKTFNLTKGDVVNFVGKGRSQATHAGFFNDGNQMAITVDINPTKTEFRVKEL